MQMRQQNGWLLVLSLSQESWLHVWLVGLWYMCVPLCCLMWLCLRQHSEAIRLPVNWPVLWESVSKTKSITLFSVWSGVALQPDTTNHSPDVPAPHNSPMWNSTNPISAAVVSTARPHSWACHQPPDKTPLITRLHLCHYSQKYVDPNRQLKTPPLRIYGCTIVSSCHSKGGLASKSPLLTFRSITGVPSAAWAHCHAAYSNVLDEKIKKKDRIYVLSHKNNVKIAQEGIELRSSSDLSLAN